MTASRDFHLGDVLTVLTGRMLSPRGMDGVYDILDFLTGGSLLTHQLVRALSECRGPLLAQHPDLAGVDVPELAQVAEWLDEQVARFGETRTVATVPEHHQRIDPIKEAAAMFPGVHVIVAGTAPQGDDRG